MIEVDVLTVLSITAALGAAAGYLLRAERSDKVKRFWLPAGLPIGVIGRDPKYLQKTIADFLQGRAVPVCSCHRCSGNQRAGW